MIGQDYPRPIVDHQKAREENLKRMGQAYQAGKLFVEVLGEHDFRLKYSCSSYSVVSFALHDFLMYATVCLCCFATTLLCAVLFLSYQDSEKVAYFMHALDSCDLLQCNYYYCYY